MLAIGSPGAAGTHDAMESAMTVKAPKENVCRISVPNQIAVCGPHTSAEDGQAGGAHLDWNGIDTECAPHSYPLYGPRIGAAGPSAGVTALCSRTRYKARIPRLQQLGWRDHRATEAQSQ